MAGMGERAYMYAKACGIIGKSFVGRRSSALASVTRLSELDRLVFPRTARDLPERELLFDLERRLYRRSAEKIISVINSFAKPPDFLVRLLRSYEYADLKSCLNAIIAGEHKPPMVTDLGKFGVLRFGAYPDLPGMVKDSEFSWLCGEELSDAAAEALQTKLDQQYYRLLWAAMYKLVKNDRTAIEGILREEISLRNDTWALRLRTYYNMDAHEVRERLVSITPQGGWGGKAGGGSSLDADAIASLSLPLDNPGEWKKWKPAGMLNPERPGESWKADPRYFQNAAAVHLYRITYQAMRRRPLSMDTAACFIKLMQFEEDYLTSLAEGLSLGMSALDVSSLLETQL